MTHYKETAIHEAGHALMYYLYFGNLNEVLGITVHSQPVDDTLGVCRRTRKSVEDEDETIGNDYYTLDDFNTLVGLICYLVAGGVAVKIWKDGSRLNRYSMSSDLGHIEYLFQFSCNINEKEKKTIIDYATMLTEKVLSDNKLTLEEIANALLNAPDMTLTGSQVLSIIKSKEEQRKLFDHILNESEVTQRAYDERSKKNTK